MTFVDVSDLAEDDLLEITAFLADASLVAAERFIQTFTKVIDDLRQFPEIGRQDLEDPATRILNRGNYRFVYEVSQTGLMLLRILDGRRRNA